jgi:Putative Actinobacterial Holin-X, holin superfamily III
MHTHETEKRGVGPAVKEVAEHASALARLEMELATLELKRKVAAFGIGVGLGVAAGVFLLFALGFGLAAGAAALALVVSTWLALLIVFGGVLLLALILGVFAMRAIKAGTPPVPEQAMAEAKLTTEAIKGNGAH